NYAAGGQLVMRTLLETTASKVWLNEYGVSRVFKAAAKTTVDNPFLMMKDPADRDFVNRAVLNTLSERFAEAFVATALGEPVVKGPLYFGVTCEKYEDIRRVKLRVLLVEARALEELFGPEGTAETLEVNNPVYRARLATLRVMYELYAKGKTSGPPLLGRVE